MHGKVSIRLSFAILIAPLGLVAPPQAYAQDQAMVLEEIIVTARKRVESLQDISQSVSALSAAEIDASFARDIRDLEGMAPNLIIDRIGAGPGVAGISIRGVTHQDLEKSFDPAVGVVLDGIFLGTNTGQELQIFDMERIEVLRGPQGTLFGRNSIGGVINVTRTDPTGELGAKLRGTYGDYERLDLEAVVNFPIMEDTLAGKLNYVSREQDEGFAKNIETGEDVPQTDYLSYGIDLQWAPTDELIVDYHYQRQEDDGDTGATSNISQPGDLLCFGFGRCGKSLTEPELGIGVVDQNFSNEQFLELDAHTLEVNWELGDDYVLTYLYGNRESEEGTNQDFDSTNIDFFSTLRLQEYEQDSHELRLAGTVSDALQFTLGGYLWDSEYQLDQTTFFLLPVISPLPEGTVNRQFTQQDTEAWAVFFEADYAFTDSLILTVGGRYTTEEKTFRSRAAAEIPGLGLLPATFDIFDTPTNEEWTEFTPKVSLAWHTTDDIMLYGTYSEGFRSGGMNGRAASAETASLIYDPEFVEMFEAGMKSSWMDNRIQFNAAVFYQTYDDKQEELVVPSPTAGQETITVNAAEATMQGIEIETRALITQNWLVSLNVGILDAEYDTFVSERIPGVPADLSYLDMRRAPDYTYALNTSYDIDLGGGTATLQAVYRYKDDMATTFLNEPFGIAEGHGLLDASASYQYENWNVRVFGRNLTDEDEVNSALSVGGLFSFQARRAPRTWGVQVTWEL
jgi:iron complex outermembrane recepter protein